MRHICRRPGDNDQVLACSCEASSLNRVVKARNLSLLYLLERIHDGAERIGLLRVTERASAAIVSIDLQYLVRKYASTVGLALIAATLFVNGLHILQTSAATSALAPNSNVTSEWPTAVGSSGCAGACGAVNEGTTPDTSSYIATDQTNNTRVQEFGMTTASNIEEATSITVRVHANTVAVGSDNDTLTLNARINGTLQGAQTYTPSAGSWGWLEATYTGSWTQADIDSLQVQLTRSVVGGGQPAGRADEIRVSTVYAELEYTVSALTEQSSYRWFENEDGADIDASNWTEMTETADWGERRSHASVVFDNKMWIIGGTSYANDIWSSTDGVNWTEEVSSAAWSGRMDHEVIVYNGQMWLFGGRDTDGQRNDVWFSPDGVNWTEATNSAPWAERQNHTALAFDNKMWVIGGSYQYGPTNDIWSSTDGVNWVEETDTASWRTRSAHVSLVFDNKMWVIGGMGSSNTPLNDVWSSSDGVNWTEETSSAGWMARSGHSVILYKNKLWVMGGRNSTFSITFNDIWSSADGANWTQEANSASWESRAQHTSLVYDDKMWVFGGYGSGGSMDELGGVWSSNMSAEIGSALAAQDTPIEAPAEGTPFRLRSTISADQGDIAAGALDLKLQYADVGPGGACSSDFSGVEYRDVRASDEKGDLNSIDKLPDPSELPTGNTSYGTTFSPDGKYMSVAHNASPYITIYEVDSTTNTFTKLPNPSDLPSNTANGIAFSPDGKYMSVAHNTSPFVTIYEVDSSTNTFTKLPNPGELPANAGYDIAFSPDGKYMSVAHAWSPFVTIYEVDSSTNTFTKLSNPGELPAGSPTGTAFSPDGQYMSVAHYDSPYITIYEVDSSTNTFTKLSNPGELPASTGLGTTFSPDGKYMSVAHYTSPFVTIYEVDSSTNTFTKLPNPGELPAATSYGTTFSPDGKYMSVAHNASPYITIYEVDSSTNTFTKLPNPGELPTNGGRDIAFSPDGKYMSVAHWESPSITIYEYDFEDLPIKFYDNSQIPNGAGAGSLAEDPDPGFGNAHYQSYVESNNFTNLNAIPDGDYGIWDFSLVDNHAPGGTTYCFRIVDSGGGELSTYTVIPEFSIPPPTTTQDSYRWFENEPPSADEPWALAETVTTGNNIYTDHLLEATNGDIFWSFGTGGSGDFSAYLYRSTDGGITWALAETVPTGWNIFTDHLLEATNGDLFWSFGSGDYNTYLYRSTDGGTTWTSVETVSTGHIVRTDHLLEATNGDLYWSFGSQDDTAYLYRSTDGGTTWNETESVVTANTIQTDHLIEATNGDLYWSFASDNGIAYLYRSTDGGTTWNETESVSTGGTVRTDHLLEATNGDLYWSFGSSQTNTAYLYRSTDGGTTWNETESVSTGGAVRTDHLLEATNGDLYWSFGSNDYSAYLYRSTDGGSTWNETESVSTGSWLYTDHLLEATNGDLYWSFGSGNSGYLYASTDGGTAWTLVETVETGGVHYTDHLLEASSGDLYWSFASNAESAYLYRASPGIAEVGVPLAAEGAPATLESPNQAVRLRMLFNIDDKDAAQGDFKLQYAPRIGSSCSTSFAGFSYTDVLLEQEGGDMTFFSNEDGSTGLAIGQSANDPSSTRGVVNQVYVESNNFSLVSETLRGAAAMWDFSIYDNSSLGGNYCFRVVRADGSLLEGYNHIAELGTPPRTIQQLRHGRWFDTAEQGRPFYW